MSKPVEVEFLMKDKLTPGMNKAEREALELRNTVRLLEAELERLRLAGETAAPNLDQSANIAQIHALEKQLEELRGKLKLLQEESESVQVTPADMPNAQRQFNGLHNSIQQMAREMPSLAMGPQMFFLAISNNLPIFTDELARARKEYDELQKSGKKGMEIRRVEIQVADAAFAVSVRNHAPAHRLPHGGILLRVKQIFQFVPFEAGSDFHCLSPPFLPAYSELHRL